jgi:hypothetical protein
MVTLLDKTSRKGSNSFSLEISLDDLRLLKLYISHHNLCDYRGVLVTPRMFFHSLIKGWIDDELYVFKRGLDLGNLDIDTKLEVKDGE